ncbi:MAG TPA: vitamin K epoxide reductase family protein [Gemmatimonadota bacterium]|nr:vitamin K epoxide reductase family protein [Gemmatimonadota bacterium]
MTVGVWIARALALVGFADAAYLTATHYAGAPVFCGASGGCETVLTSEYATVGPVPVAVVGAAYYAVASLSAWTPLEAWSRRTAAFLATLIGAGFVVTAVLVWLQATVIGAWCRFCLVSAAITTLLLFTALYLLRVVSKEPEGAVEP